MSTMRGVCPACGGTPPSGTTCTICYGVGDVFFVEHPDGYVEIRAIPQTPDEPDARVPAMDHVLTLSAQAIRIRHQEGCITPKVGVRSFINKDRNIVLMCYCETCGHCGIEEIIH